MCLGMGRELEPLGIDWLKVLRAEDHDVSLNDFMAF